jgi:hypothetical protein
MEPLLNGALPAPAKGAVFKRLPEGGVLFSTETEVYFGVGSVGARIWELLPPASKTIDELVAVLAAQYRDVSASQIRSDVEAFLRELLENGLVVFDAAARPRDGTVP